MAKKTSKKAVKKTSAKKSVKSVKSVKKASSKKTTASSKKTAAPKKKRALNPALKAPYNIGKDLAEIVGSSPMPRQEVVSKIWKYIKKHGLQDSNNRQAINADDKLKVLFGGKKQVNMFEMQKYISKQLTKA